VCTDYRTEEGMWKETVLASFKGLKFLEVSDTVAGKP